MITPVPKSMSARLIARHAGTILISLPSESETTVGVLPKKNAGIVVTNVPRNVTGPMKIVTNADLIVTLATGINHV